MNNTEIVSTTYTCGDGSIVEIRSDMTSGEIQAVQARYWASYSREALRRREQKVDEDLPPPRHRNDKQHSGKIR